MTESGFGSRSGRGICSQSLSVTSPPVWPTLVCILFLMPLPLSLSASEISPCPLYIRCCSHPAGSQLCLPHLCPTCPRCFSQNLTFCWPPLCCVNAAGGQELWLTMGWLLHLPMATPEPRGWGPDRAKVTPTLCPEQGPSCWQNEKNTEAEAKGGWCFCGVSRKQFLSRPRAALRDAKGLQGGSSVCHHVSPHHGPHAEKPEVQDVGSITRVTGRTKLLLSVSGIPLLRMSALLCQC